MLTRLVRGFGLIELLIAVSILAILTAVTVPNLMSWIRGARTRAVADALQSGLRAAQVEAQRRSHTVVFFFTNSKVCSTGATAIAGGKYWQARVVPDVLQSGDVSEAVQCGVLTDVGSGVSVTPSATAICFGGDGRLTAATDPTTIGVDCTAAAANFQISPDNRKSQERRLTVTLSLAGAVRMCDPDKSSAAPDGCRAS
jgi:type IV fimbrial biogenesis protein FimT